MCIATKAMAINIHTQFADIQSIIRTFHVSYASPDALG
jgi:hypothetical protein